ncbi:hypothetical protein [Pelomonas sp. SE-A7]|uniref:hypothetical protein n=1 Tax=Pelomonas sp. SE-A7 TaxID=3054953 RepID=UPI00259C8CF7|nr:hypothetical protein [Pelomonas sp. SE-A7]MDM4765534.1 hypothetical protein [Pelomonas sp. SE-A7]
MRERVSLCDLAFSFRQREVLRPGEGALLTEAMRRSRAKKIHSLAQRLSELVQRWHKDFRLYAHEGGTLDETEALLKAELDDFYSDDVWVGIDANRLALALYGLSVHMHVSLERFPPKKGRSGRWEGHYLAQRIAEAFDRSALAFQRVDSKSHKDKLAERTLKLLLEEAGVSGAGDLDTYIRQARKELAGPGRMPTKLKRVFSGP